MKPADFSEKNLGKLPSMCATSVEIRISSVALLLKRVTLEHNKAKYMGGMAFVIRFTRLKKKICLLPFFWANSVGFQKVLESS